MKFLGELPLGQTVPDFAVTVYNAAGAPADAGAVTLTIELPDATTVDLTTSVTHDGVGLYSALYTPPDPGHYVARWVATGANASAEEQSWDVAAAYQSPGAVVTLANFATYLGNPEVATVGTSDYERASMILSDAQTLCETIVKPLPTGAYLVVRDVAERAFANPVPEGNTGLGFYGEGLGPYSPNTPGTTGGGLYLTQSNIQTLRRLAGQTGGAFTIDLLPTDAGTNLPYWDTGAVPGWL